MLFIKRKTYCLTQSAPSYDGIWAEAASKNPIIISFISAATIPSDDKTTTPEVYSAFDGVEYVSDEPALDGEEDILTNLNADSELNINSSGDSKIQELIEHAANGDKSFDDIMSDWNAAWTSAQETEGVTVE